MPKNKGKGGKNRRRGKNENESEKRELIFKEDEQEYAQVIKMLGNGRLEAMCFDGQKRLCHIRGKMRKKVSGIDVGEKWHKTRECSMVDSETGTLFLGLCVVSPKVFVCMQRDSQFTRCICNAHTFVWLPVDMHTVHG